ncbi:hypothetical protein EJF36_13040 [Bacillus sp. HMF5848]|nr:hypothetical protein EJF36_13040 [Bacillus sp. HMF5848]
MQLKEEKSSTGLEVNIAGLLCYILGIFTGILFLVIEKESTFVKFHAMQSVITSAFLFVITTVLSFIPIIGWLISLLLSPLCLILWIVLMLQAYKGKKFKLPIVGDIAEKQVIKA